MAAETNSITSEELLDLLELNERDHVADLGCGTGFLTIPIARIVSTDVHAVDLDRGALEELKRRAEELQVENILYEHMSFEYIRFSQNTLHKVITRFVLHELPNLVKVIQDLRDMLKDDGLWLIIETEALPQGDSLSSDDLVRKLQSAGYEVERGYLRSTIYYLIARKAVRRSSL
ncbi:SAM-dependent methyltransferase [Rossellomorea marisflavi]|uniref:class I SAM-dependent methyltransferase n=1 Tax=Rossellomorea marisflavi TaxID=189381 RepID=UPI0025CB0A0B|nr:class I SAM-dependent methyltransferase [Rossellomorea marisflavi]GLI85209.1 SAM-dependent methyltransferase [Rossellomorea marisflavi]